MGAPQVARRVAGWAEGLMDRLEPLWRVGPKPVHSPLRGWWGTVVGLVLVHLSLAFTLILLKPNPARPHLLDLDALARSSRRITRDASAYADVPGRTPFIDSPIAAWAGRLLTAGIESVPWWPVVLWIVLNAFGVWLLCRLIGLRDWRAGLLATTLVNIYPFSYVIGRGNWLVLLAVAFLVCVLTPDWGRFEKFRGVPAGLAVAWQPFLAPLLVVLWAAKGRLPVLRAAAVAGGLTVLGALLSPRDTLTFFFRVLPSRYRLPGYAPERLDNQSPVGAWYRLVGDDGAILVRGGVIVVAVLVLWLAYRVALRGQLLLAVTLAGLGLTASQAFPQEYTWIWAVLGVLALWSGKVPFPTRIIGLGVCLWYVVKPWEFIVYRRFHKGHLSVYEQIVTNFGPVMLLVMFAVVAIDMYRTRQGRTIPAHSRSQVLVVRTVLVWLPFLAALWMAGTFTYSRPWPWQAWMPDYEVYVNAGRDMLAGRDMYFYDAASNKWPWLYPPFAALLTYPMAIGFRDECAVLLQFLNAAAFSLLFYRGGLRGWQVPFATSAAILMMQVLTSDFRFGNIQGLMIALVFLDLVPGGAGLCRLLPRSWGRRERLLPQGVVLGFVTALKLIPGLFIIYLLLTRRYKAALTAIGVFVACTVVGCLALPSAAMRFGQMLLHGELSQGVVGDSVHFLSPYSAVLRFLGGGAQFESAAKLIAYFFGGITFLAALRWYRAGHEWFGAALCGIATISLSPIAWAYYYVWMVPAAIAVFSSRRLGESAHRQDADETMRIRHGLPESTELLTLAITLWASFQFHLWIGYDEMPNPGFIDKLVAGALPLGCMLLGVLALVLQRRPGRAYDPGQGPQLDPERAAALDAAEEERDREAESFQTTSTPA